MTSDTAGKKTPASNLYLVGYRCTGKSAVGRRLAERLKRRFIDADAEIVAQLGTSIAAYVARHGWQAFRSKEAAVIRSVSRLKAAVVATGGGAVLAEVNRRIMRDSGRVVWLKAAPAVIKQRLAQDDSTPALRPPLSGDDAADEIEEMLAVRTPLYREVAQLAVDTDQLAIEQICDRIVDRMGL